MENLKRNFGELISVLAATFFLSAVVYILAYSNTLGVEISKYFKLSDYVDVAIGSLGPTVILLIIGVLVGYVDESVPKNIIIAIRFTMFVAYILTFLRNFSVIPAALILVLGILLKNKKILKFKPPSSEKAFVILITLLLFSYLSGGVHAGLKINKKNKENAQTIILSDRKQITGNVLYVLSDCIIVLSNEKDFFNVIMREDVTQIIEFIE